LDTTAVKLVNASGLNRASCLVQRSVKNSELWIGSFQYSSQPH
jgi:hypothetical protein